MKRTAGASAPSPSFRGSRVGASVLFLAKGNGRAYNEGVILAIISDIHANLEALQAVLADAESHGADAWLCLGDMVGFNGDPETCLDLLRPRLSAAVRGNHEAALLDRSLFGASIFSRMMDTTERRLHPGQKEWIQSLPLTTASHHMLLAHACFDAPWQWKRLVTAEKAVRSFQAAAPFPVAWFGHSHYPTLFTCQGREVKQEPLSYGADGSFSLPLREDTRYLINPGSVGQPRDGDWRAAYALYEPENRRLTLRRVRYDVQAAADKIERMGLPDSFRRALREGRNPIR